MEKIVENYQLRWSDDGNGGGSSSKRLELFHNIYGDNSYQQMIIRLKYAYSKLDKKYSSVLLCRTMTGLRPAEACASLQLLKERREAYLTKDCKIRAFQISRCLYDENKRIHIFL